MNKEMAQLKKDVEHWLRLTTETKEELELGRHSDVYEQYKGRIEAYEHVLVMINSVTLLFDYGIGVGNPDWGKKK